MPNVIAVPCDVTDPDQVLAAASTIGGHTGGTLDLLINNAGYSSRERGDRSGIDARVPACV
jgi:NAD(P)-dependent dehydrogenase (short-subunit alcohol dehydrogenase family)